MNPAAWARTVARRTALKLLKRAGQELSLGRGFENFGILSLEPNGHDALVKKEAVLPVI